MHSLEYLLLVLSKRIRDETGNDDLADAASRLASASHSYDAMHEPKLLEVMCEDWRRRFNNTDLPGDAFRKRSRSGTTKRNSKPRLDDAISVGDMRIQAILKRLKENPKHEKNVRSYRKILDASEAADSEALRAFVNEWRKKI